MGSGASDAMSEGVRGKEQWMRGKGLRGEEEGSEGSEESEGSEDAR
jgi:hypothetical protein